MTDIKKLDATYHSADRDTSPSELETLGEATSEERRESSLSVHTDIQLPYKRRPSQISVGDEEEEEYQDDASYVGDGNHTQLSVKVPFSSASSDSGTVCLCQPDPKVPRPRNAFILYRQHYQAEVARKNPKLANPEISKIIGEHWRRASEKTKETWKSLAEEEKARHQKQYPNYRYQPRRAGRFNQQSEQSSNEPSHCLKCGGKTMSTRLPATPGGIVPSTPPPSNTGNYRQHPPAPVSTSHQSQPHSRITSSPRSSYTSRPSYSSQSPHSLASLSIASSYHPNYRGEDASSPVLSPEAKRRRFDSAYLHGAGRSLSVVGNMVGPPLAGYDHHRRRVSSLTRPEFMHASTNGMPANSKLALSAPSPRSSAYIASTRSNNGNSNLTLAPFNIQPNSTGIKGVEAMVMSIPILNKIKVLSKISPPLSMARPRSPSFKTRGAIIAIEGHDDEVIKTIITRLRDGLQREEEFKVKLYYGGRFGGRSNSSSSNSSTGTTSQNTTSNHSITSNNDPGGRGFSEWLSLINEWHHESADVRNFIAMPLSTKTAAPISVDPTPTPASPQISPHTIIEKPKMRTRSSTSPTTTTTSTGAPTPGLSSKDTPSPSNTANRDPNAMDTRPDNPTTTTTTTKESTVVATPEEKEEASPMPIAIIPRYQLSLTDQAASCVPIGDEYSPTDHWQWMATLWRGIVGPDITIVVKSAAGNGAGEEGKDAGVSAGNGGGGGGSSSSSGGVRGEDVEIRLDDYRAIVCRCESQGRIEEKVLRRVGFEVEEWLRGMKKA